jgi:hypothetical protein
MPSAAPNWHDLGQVSGIAGEKQLVYKLYRQSGAAPLVFVLGGIGANVFSGVSRFTADLLFREGFVGASLLAILRVIATTAARIASKLAPTILPSAATKHPRHGSRERLIATVVDFCSLIQR